MAFLYVTAHFDHQEPRSIQLVNNNIKNLLQQLRSEFQVPDSHGFKLSFQKDVNDVKLKAINSVNDFQMFYDLALEAAARRTKAELYVTAVPKVQPGGSASASSSGPTVASADAAQLKNANNASPAVVMAVPVPVPVPVTKPVSVSVSAVSVPAGSNPIVTVGTIVLPPPAHATTLSTRSPTPEKRVVPQAVESKRDAEPPLSFIHYGIGDATTLACLNFTPHLLKQGLCRVCNQTEAAHKQPSEKPAVVPQQQQQLLMQQLQQQQRQILQLQSQLNSKSSASPSPQPPAVSSPPQSLPSGIVRTAAPSLPADPRPAGLSVVTSVLAGNMSSLPSHQSSTFTRPTISSQRPPLSPSSASAALAAELLTQGPPPSTEEDGVGSAPPTPSRQKSLNSLQAPTIAMPPPPPVSPRTQEQISMVTELHTILGDVPAPKPLVADKTALSALRIGKGAIEDNPELPPPPSDNDATEDDVDEAQSMIARQPTTNLAILVNKPQAQQQQPKPQTRISVAPFIAAATATAAVRPKELAVAVDSATSEVKSASVNNDVSSFTVDAPEQPQHAHNVSFAAMNKNPNADGSGGAGLPNDAKALNVVSLVKPLVFHPAINFHPIATANTTPVLAPGVSAHVASVGPTGVSPPTPLRVQQLHNAQVIEEGEVTLPVAAVAVAEVVAPSSGISSVEARQKAVEFYSQGTAHSKKENWAKAIEAFDASIHLDTNRANSYFARGMAYGTIGHFAEAISDCGRYLELEPNITKHALAYFNRGLAYNNQAMATPSDADRLFDLAFADWDKALAIKANFPEVYSARANTYTHLKQYALAIEDHTRAIRLAPTPSAQAYHARASTYAQSGQLREALEDDTKAVQLEPTLFKSWYNRGWEHLQLDEVDAAIEDFTHVIKLQPKLDKGYSSRAQAYEKKGNTDEAFRDYSNAVELNPTDARSQAARTLIAAKKAGFKLE